jgi:hypothetical protein
MLIATKFVLVAKGRPTFGSIDINVECKRQANRKRTANGEPALPVSRLPLMRQQLVNLTHLLRRQRASEIGRLLPHKWAPV